jgi:cobalt-precorrin-5B (C1)-methyltransferase
MTIKVTLSAFDGEGIRFIAGEGVGTVTKKGLSIPPGQPAINPVPREMITTAIREVTDRSLKVMVSISDGERVGAKTFNPKLGIVGGLSILGTTGIVRPYSHPAIKESLKCMLSVAIAGGAKRPVFTAGNIGTRSAVALGMPKEHIIEVGNEWGFMLDSLEGKGIKSMLAVGHPGKLVKLIAGDFDTHSSRSKSALPTLAENFRELFGSGPEELATAEGFFLSLEKSKREEFADYISLKIAKAIKGRLKDGVKVTVALVNMESEIIGDSGGLEEWRR